MVLVVVLVVLVLLLLLVVVLVEMQASAAVVAGANAAAALLFIAAAFFCFFVLASTRTVGAGVRAYSPPERPLQRGRRRSRLRLRVLERLVGVAQPHQVLVLQSQDGPEAAPEHFPCADEGSLCSNTVVQ